MAQERRIVGNADNGDVMPFSNEHCLFGYVPEVNGHGAEEIAGFIPTRHELLLLMKHWYRTELHNAWYIFVCGSVGSSELCQTRFARNRVSRIAGLLGDDEVNEAFAEVNTELSKGVSAEDWDIFSHGDQAQWDAFQEKIRQECEARESEHPNK